MHAAHASSERQRDELAHGRLIAWRERDITVMVTDNHVSDGAEDDVARQPRARQRAALALSVKTSAIMAQFVL